MCYVQFCILSCSSASCIMSLFTPQLSAVRHYVPFSSVTSRLRNKPHQQQLVSSYFILQPSHWRRGLRPHLPCHPSPLSGGCTRRFTSSKPSDVPAVACCYLLRPLILPSTASACGFDWSGGCVISTCGVHNVVINGIFNRTGTSCPTTGSCSRSRNLPCHHNL